MILEFLKSLWNAKHLNDFNKERHTHQWWMIIIGLITLFHIVAMLLVNAGWLVAGFVGAAAWHYRDEILVMVTTNTKDT